jgi:hypothetical protein
MNFKLFIYNNYWKQGKSYLITHEHAQQLTKRAGHRFKEILDRTQWLDDPKVQDWIRNDFQKGKDRLWSEDYEFTYFQEL